MVAKARSALQQAAVQQADAFSAHTYAPLPVVIAEGRGAVVTDLDGHEYLDCLAAYSAVNFGHGNARLLAVAQRQLHRLTLTSRAFYSEPFGPFAEALAGLCGKDMILPMNTGAEAVETAIKTARKWGYEARGVPEGEATIVVMDGNFHGRTTTIISFSNDAEARRSYSPFTPGFRSVPFGDLPALEAAIDDTTVAVLFEPIQGEAGVIVPPEGFLRGVREVTSRRGVLMVADEIQAGLGRAGETFACDREGVVPDVYVLGKALGGGIVPLSAIAADADILGLFRPGQHGSTFGGNPLACALGTEVVAMLREGDHQRASRERGAQLAAGLQPLLDRGRLTGLRQAGLWLGLDVDPALGTARELCYRLMDKGVLAKDTHGQTIRFAPPLVITPGQVDRVVELTLEAFDEEARRRTHDADGDARPEVDA